GAYTGTATIRLTATDSLSGVASSRYVLDGGPETAGTDISVTYSGTHELTFWSVDRAGNTESRKTVTFTVTGGVVDSVPPVTTTDAVAQYLGGATITLSASDTGGTGVRFTRYRLDGGAILTGAVVGVPGPASATESHTLEYWSEDYAGNIEATKSVSFSCLFTGSGTITFMWNAESGSVAEYWVWDASGTLIVNTRSDEIPGWYGFYTATVPVDSRPYFYQVTWYDSYYDSDGVTTGDALIDSAGKAYSTWY
ncbi:MAG: hypothetical protein Q8K89_09400, partial [Actinomycetota bacterium]|nr:hypothetical protein [Actinomycetota bacterium]